MRREYDLYVLCGKCGCQKSKLECERELIEAKKQQSGNCSCRCKIDCTTGEPYCTCSETDNSQFCKCKGTKPCKQNPCNCKETKTCEEKPSSCTPTVPCGCSETIIPDSSCGCDKPKGTSKLAKTKDYKAYEDEINELMQSIDIQIPDAGYEVRADIVL